MSTTKKNTDATTAYEVDTVKFPVEIKGKTIELECVADILDAPLEAGRCFEEGKTFKLFEILLGEAQMDKLSAAGATVRDFSENIVKAWSEASGLGN